MIDPVTSRYAEALFGLAKKRGALDAVCADVERLAGQLAAPGAAELYFDARVPVEKRREGLVALAASMHELTRNFVALVVDKRREEVLTGLGAAFRRRLLEDKGAAEGVVESARPLGEPEIARLAASLSKHLAKDVTLTNEVNPAVVGGVRVIVGSQMIDGSIRGRLDGLKKRMAVAALPSLTEG